MVRENQTGIMNQLFSFLDVIPEDAIALTAYGIGAIIALWCWWRLMRRLPTTFGAISWLIAFAILVTPTVSEGPILFVVGLGLVVGYFWSKYSTSKSMRSI